MDEFYKGVKADIADFVVSLWEGSTDEEKNKIWKYIRDYWDFVQHTLNPKVDTRNREIGGKENGQFRKI